MKEINDVRIYKMKSGLKYSMDKKTHEELELVPKSLLICEGCIVAREYFIQFHQVVAILILVFLGYTRFYQILWCDLIVGVLYMFVYRILPLYTIITVSIISNFFGVFIFRFFIHFVIIGILSFTVLNNSWIFVYYIFSRIITFTTLSIINGYKQTLKQNNEIADYVLNLTRRNI